MQRSELKEKEYQELLGRIVPILLRKGMKSTTMDTVAASLGMSKRTLYEIFPSKTEMIKEALGAMERQNLEYCTEVFHNSDNVMVALIAIFKHNRDLIGSVNVQFYRDMDRLYKTSREEYEKSRETRHENMLKMFKLGVQQGMFRPDVDYSIQSRMMGLQMEGLKRIEELFPPGISLLQVFDAIILGFLRSIASKKGMKVLEEEITKLKKQGLANQ